MNAQYFHGLLTIVVNCVIVYALVLVGLRVSGKREIGQMTPFDLALLLLLSNAVQNAMTGPDTTLVGGATAAVTLLLVNAVVSRLSGRSRRLRRMIEGEPSLIIHDGKINEEHMRREHVTIDELNQALREHGVASVQDVAIGVLEIDGSISLLKHEDTPTFHERRRAHSLLRKP